MSRRVVVTGIGVVTPLGIGRKSFTERLMGGESAVSTIKSFDTSHLPSHLGAEVVDFDPKDYIDGKALRKMDRISRMAAAAASMAVEDAGLKINESNRDRVGIILGVSMGSTDVSIKIIDTIFSEGPTMINPILVPNTVMNAPAGHASIVLGLRGINSTVNHKEASAETATAYAAGEIANGRADAILAGGADIISPFPYEVLTRFRALSPAGGGKEGARPFDRGRNGFVYGEGAGIILLESLDAAQERGAEIFAEVLGWGMSAAPSAPNDWPEETGGTILAMRRAIESAGLNSGEVDYISASANGGKRLDRLEAESIGELFGRFDGKAKSPIVSSIKGAVGESLSSGGVRSAAAVISLKYGIVPPTLNLNEPIAPLNFVVGKKRIENISTAMVNGFSSGGTFVSLIFGKFDRSTK
ncbi:MAG: beta-ketoacyl-[acyl-carrier-protein] synthase family protein [Deltaproteobacteria bacterium]|uniref:Beta-ketoacyl-[acyl-carrier-protein] synthase family protein n=1 Tax=Candidatus Zymogenus saltonus TaxID=2844893 RepID=A0A9D8KHC9_9DELT|nr:beta-ketoacyl-[acyl-carrier-protein] synthase family protein [Candidatus Zymogenus saltonus]